MPLNYSVNKQIFFIYLFLYNVILYFVIAYVAYILATISLLLLAVIDVTVW